MPLFTATPRMAARSPANPHYLIFFSSGAPPWCPDCVAALPAIHAVFGKDSGAAGAEAELLTVGREEWKVSERPIGVASSRAQYAEQTAQRAEWQLRLDL
jgi:hypothetical protein